jgi:hypothetical protein
MTQHPETSYRLAQQRLHELRQQAAAERLARSAGNMPFSLTAFLTARLASLFMRPRAMLAERQRAERRPEAERRASARAHDPVDL